jgi:hypothetical protein
VESILPPPGGLPGKVIEAYAGEYTDGEDDSGYDVTDIGFYHVKTDKGDMTIELRVSHNGYYGGSLDFAGFESRESIIKSRQETFQVMRDAICEENWERVEMMLKEIKKLDGELPPNEQTDPN